MGFIAITILDVFISLAVIELGIAFAAVYVGVCTFINSCIDDVSIVIDHVNANIDHKVSFRDELMQIIELHANCYR